MEMPRLQTAAGSTVRDSVFAPVCSVQTPAALQHCSPRLGLTDTDITALIVTSIDPPPLAGFGLQVTCILTFVIMFLPRSRQLTAMGKEGLYLEDHEDQVSLHRHDTEEMSYNQVQQQVFKVPGEIPY